MANKVPLKKVTNILTSVGTLNEDFERIEEGFDKTLSRDGSGPNQMEALLDMNNYPIINLPKADRPGMPITYDQIDPGAQEVVVVPVGPDELTNDPELLKEMSNKILVEDGNTLQDAISVAKTPIDLLQTTKEFPIGSIIRTGDGFLYQVAPADATDAHVETAGGVKLYVLPDERARYNIRAFGAVGDNVVDDTAVIQKAVDVAAALGGTVYVPRGNFRVSGNIVLPTMTHICGENRNTSVLFGVDNTKSILVLNGPHSVIEDLYIRGGYSGISHITEGSFNAIIRNNRIQYNRIGINMANAYITTISQNYIAFNSVGIVSGPQSFQVNIHDNVIDNNIGVPSGWGGAGILSYGTAGLSIRGNTIEGNRNEASPGGPSNGVGVWIVGISQRVVLDDNWYEQNGNQDGSADIILGRPDADWVDTLASLVVPPTYSSHFAPTNPTFGVISITDSFFFLTQRGIVVSAAGNNANTTIKRNQFVGGLDKYNKPVVIAGNQSARLTLEGNYVFNSGNVAITPQMMQGVKASYAYYEPRTAGHIPPYGAVTLDGEDLFTARMTTAEFLGLPGATLNVEARAPTSGTATIVNGAVKTFGGGSGVRTVAGTGRARAGSSAVFSGAEHVWAVIARGSGAGWTIQGGGSFAFLPANDSNGRALIHERTNLTQTEATLHTGDYFGWVVMTKEQFDNSSIRGVRRLEITDIQMSEALPPGP